MSSIDLRVKPPMAAAIGRPVRHSLLGQRRITLFDINRPKAVARCAAASNPLNFK